MVLTSPVYNKLLNSKMIISDERYLSDKHLNHDSSYTPTHTHTHPHKKKRRKEKFAHLNFVTHSILLIFVTLGTTTSRYHDERKSVFWK